MRRGKISLGLAGALGLALLSACSSAPMEERRCVDMVGSGQHSHRMVEVPCPAEPDIGGN